MKTTPKTIVVLIVLLQLISFSFAYAQATDGLPATGNVRGPLKFLGWNGTGPGGPLEIRNNFSQQMLFSTTSFTRMIISNGGGNVNAGGVAFGNNLPLGFLVLDRLHSHIIVRYLCF